MKNTIALCIGIIAFLSVFTNYSFGAKSKGLDIDIVAKQNSNMSEEALNSLKENFNYKGDVVGSNMKLDTTITFKGESILKDGTYNIQIGSASNGVTGEIISISKEDLEKLGYDFENPENLYGYKKSGKNIQWKVVLIADFKGDEDIKPSEGNSSLNDLHIHIKEAYGGTEEDYNYGLNEVNSETEEERFGAEKHYDEVQEKVENTLNDAFNFINNWKKNKMGTIFNLILDGALPQIDTIQMIANSFQTIELKTINDFKIVYNYKFLKKDGNEEYPGNTGEGAGNRNKFTNVSLGDTNSGDDSWQNIINVDINNTDLISNSGSNSNSSTTTNNNSNSNNFNTYGFSKDTKIPVIVVDSYTMATGKISAFDINFLKVDYNLHDPDASIWIKFRNIFALLTRITLYITAAILLTSLIWNGIAVMKKVTVEPKKRKKYMEGLINFIKACGMLVGVIIIMALSIYANEMFLPKVMTERKAELPNRVNVSEAGYSFSTTDTGYARYMAQMQNVDLTAAKFGYVVGYLLLTIRNLLTAIIMLLRTVIIFVLSIIGPLTVLFYAIGKPEVLPMDFRGWAKSYVAVASIQVLLAFTFSLTSAM